MIAAFKSIFTKAQKNRKKKKCPSSDHVLQPRFLFTPANICFDPTKFKVIFIFIFLFFLQMLHLSLNFKPLDMLRVTDKFLFGSQYLQSSFDFY